MTNQETNVTNAFETTLSSSLSAGATTINVDSTTGAPSVPFYAVIDPGNDSKREVVLVDDGKTSATLTLTAASKRGQDGTSDVAHDSGAVVAVVPVAALWTDINDRVEGHTHSGGTDGTAIATGDLTGHDKAAHDALGIDADTVDGSHASAFYTVANHTKANHDSLGLDHGSLSGKSDVEDHPQYVHCLGIVAETGGGQSIPAGVETTLTLDEDVVTTNCSLASNTLTVDYAGTYVVRGAVEGPSSSDASSGTLRLKVGGATQLTKAMTVGLGSFGGSLGSPDRLSRAVETVSLAANDGITLTVQLTGGSGHSVGFVELAVEKVE